MDWQLTCRTCLQSGEMVSLFDCDENNEQLCDKYLYCCGIQVTTNDSLPTLICLPCVDKLSAACDFRKQCLFSYEILQECVREILGSTNEKPDIEVQDIKEEPFELMYYEKNDKKKSAKAYYMNRCQSLGVGISHQAKKKFRKREWKNITSCVTKNDFQSSVVQGNEMRNKTNSKNKNNAVEMTWKVDQVEKRAASNSDGDQLISHDVLSQTEMETGSGKKRNIQKDIESDPDFVPDNIPVQKAKINKVQSIEQPVRRRGRKKGSKIVRLDVENPEEYLDVTHIKKKAPGQSYKCERCETTFSCKSTLRYHMRRHLGIKKYQCDLCEYAGVTRSELQRHMLRHTGVKPYKCRVCDRSFGDFGSRQKHERVHMGIRPYKCDLCGEAFTYSYALPKHMLTHSEDAEHQCKDCGVKFKWHGRLSEHIRVRHPESFFKRRLEREAQKLKSEVDKFKMKTPNSEKIVSDMMDILRGESTSTPVTLQTVE